jgi:hypothetical protein
MRAAPCQNYESMNVAHSRRQPGTFVFNVYHKAWGGYVQTHAESHHGCSKTRKLNVTS